MQDQKQSSGNPSEPSKAGKLLDPQEREVLERVAVRRGLSGQRARALSAIDEGATQAEAAQDTGLTTGQIKYLLYKFRKRRLEIFPEQDLSSSDEIPFASTSEALAEGAPVLGISTQPQPEVELQQAPSEGKAKKAGSGKEKGKGRTEKPARKKGDKARKKGKKKGKSSKKDRSSKKSKKGKNAGKKSKKQGKR